MENVFDVKKHYDNHLGRFYTWMAGDFEQKRIEFQNLLERNKIFPADTKSAIDLGCGHGIQSVALLNIGFEVTAIDFNDHLLNELKSRTRGHLITPVNGDIRDIQKFADRKPEVIVCCGDTLTHLDNLTEVEQLINDCADIIVDKGKIVLSHRDYSIELNDQQRFVPVKSDDQKILTCILEYESDNVKVTDLLYEKEAGQWIQKVSSYKKVRVSPKQICRMLENYGLRVTLHERVAGMETIIAAK